MSTSAEFRQRARNTLGNRLFSNEFLYAILAYFIVSALVGVSVYTVVGFFIVSGPLMVGLAYYYLSMVRNNGQVLPIGEVFVGFQRGMSNSLVAFLLKSLYTYLWSLLLVVPGIVKAYSYAMTDYILADHPEYTATQAINESRRMMDGNKMRLFMLDLSFVGWFLLGACTFGIGLIWVIPYAMTARTHFYEEINDRIDIMDILSDIGYDVQNESKSL